MHSSSVCAEQVHSPTAAVKQCEMNHALDKGRDRTNPFSAARGDNSAVRPFAKLLMMMMMNIGRPPSWIFKNQFCFCKCRTSVVFSSVKCRGDSLNSCENCDIIIFQMTMMIMVNE